MAQKLIISHQALLIIPPAWINIGELNLSDRANRERKIQSTKTETFTIYLCKSFEIYLNLKVVFKLGIVFFCLWSPGRDSKLLF